MSNKLHIYSQSFWHSPAMVVGNTKALLDLKAAIDKALERRHGTSHDVMTSDGEGFDVHVVRMENCDPRWDDIMYPYSDEIANNDYRGFNPYELLKYMSPSKDAPPCPECGSANPLIHNYHEPKPGEES